MSVVGTRPNFMKIGADRRASSAARPTRSSTCSSTPGQHYDDAMSERLLRRARDRRARPLPRRRLGLARRADRAGHGARSSRCCSSERARPRARPGRRELDARRGARRRRSSASRSGTSRRGCAASTAPCPRRSTGSLADAISELLFIHSPEARDNLLREGAADERDPLRRQHDDRHARAPCASASTRSTRAGAPRLERGDLPRGHAAPARRSSTAPLLARRDGRAGGGRRRAAGRVPRASAHARGIEALGLAVAAPGVRLLEPLGYLEFLGLVAAAAGVLTDSGGIQEETTFLGIPCFTLRDNTERPVTCRARDERRCSGSTRARIARGPRSDRRRGPARGARSRRAGTGTRPSASSTSSRRRSTVPRRSRRQGREGRHAGVCGTAHRELADVRESSAGATARAGWAPTRTTA